LTLCRILAVTLTAFALGALATHRSLRNAPAPMRRERWTKYLAYILIVHAVIFAALAGRYVLVALFTVILVAGGMELWRVARHARVVWLTGYAALAIALLGFLRTESAAAVIYVFCVVAAFDGFSQVVGNNFGRYQLARRISPGKTIEGALGGVFGGTSIGVWLCWLAGLGRAEAMFASICICVAALSGDLLASGFKRLNGVKDFGGLIPAHGGVLDRFDSFLLAASAWWVAKLML